MSRVLVVDDEPAICWSFRESLTDDGHDVDISATAEDALRVVDQAPPDVVLMDVRLPGMDGLTALRQIRDRIGSTPVIIMTAFGSLDTAVNAIDGGAFDYLPKPFDLDEAVEVVRRALDSSSSGPVSTASTCAAGTDGPLIGRSRAMQSVFRSIALVADRDVPVLITGESGTGKELVAHAIHQHGGRRNGPFVPISVPALNPAVIESELFGHVKGAFTGADTERPGLLDLANGGTALMDEIGDIPMPQQVKLLRLLEHREITPVGAGHSHTSNFRLVAATNRPLEQLVAGGTFRQDLFYRLNVFRIDLPPLRDRPDDIEPLARHFLTHLNEDPAALTRETLVELQSRPWHGNVRELRNAIEHAAIVARSARITADCLPSPLPPGELTGNDSAGSDQSFHVWLTTRLSEKADETAGTLYDDFLRQYEPALLRRALAATNGNRGAAARLLGIHRETLRQKLRRYRLDE